MMVSVSLLETNTNIDHWMQMFILPFICCCTLIIFRVWEGPVSRPNLTLFQRNNFALWNKLNISHNPNKSNRFSVVLQEVFKIQNFKIFTFVMLFLPNFNPHQCLSKTSYKKNFFAQQDKYVLFYISYTI